jgi:hypothetical protein
MQFKYPQLLYFLFLLVIPILVHLFQLRKFKIEYFTNVKFLKELSIQTRKSSKLKKYLLLATRLLLLAFLIIAFAQPFFKAKDSANAKNELYIVLDNSFSMQAKGKKGELLKRAVQDLLEHTPEAANFSLITCSDNFWNTDIKSIQKELQNLKYSATAFEPENLLAKIKAHKSAYNKDIVFITDAIGFKNQELKTQTDQNLFFILPEAENIKNASVDSIYINQTLDNFYEIAVKISGYGESFKDVPVSLFNKNKLIAKTLLSFEEKDKIINFTIPKEDFHGYVSISDNGLEYDNTYYFSISKPEKSNVISIGDTEKSTFLSKIYTADEFNYNHFNLSQLDYNLIDKQDAVVLNELNEIPVALQTTLKSFIQKGGNVILIPSAESTVSNMNNLLQNFGNLQYNSITNQEKMITKINFSHPVFSAVFEKKVANFQYPNTKSSFQISGVSPIILGYNDETPFLTAISKEIGAVYVFAAPINKSNSNFQNSPIIVPVFYNMAKSIQKNGVTSIIIGENKPFIIETLLGKDEIVNIKNEKESFIPVQQILNNKAKLTFNENPKEAGNFEITNNNQVIENISFNYNRIESNLKTKNTNIASSFKEFDDIETLFNTLQHDRKENSLWKWFVVLALLFLVIEILIQKFVK